MGILDNFLTPVAADIPVQLSFGKAQWRSIYGIIQHQLQLTARRWVVVPFFFRNPLILLSICISFLLFRNSIWLWISVAMFHRLVTLCVLIYFVFMDLKLVCFGEVMWWRTKHAVLAMFYYMFLIPVIVWYLSTCDPKAMSPFRVHNLYMSAYTFAQIYGAASIVILRRKIIMKYISRNSIHSTVQECADPILYIWVERKWNL